MVQSVPVDVTAAALCDLCEGGGTAAGAAAAGATLHLVSGAPPKDRPK